MIFVFILLSLQAKISNIYPNTCNILYPCKNFAFSQSCVNSRSKSTIQSPIYNELLLKIDLIPSGTTMKSKKQIFFNFFDCLKFIIHGIRMICTNFVIT